MGGGPDVSARLCVFVQVCRPCEAQVISKPHPPEGGGAVKPAARWVLQLELPASAAALHERCLFKVLAFGKVRGFGLHMSRKVARSFAANTHTHTLMQTIAGRHRACMSKCQAKDWTQTSKATIARLVSCRACDLVARHLPSEHDHRNPFWTTLRGTTVQLRGFPITDFPTPGRKPHRPKPKGSIISTHNTGSFGASPEAVRRTGIHRRAHQHTLTNAQKCPIYAHLNR